jgi:hypothetical protein
MPFEMGQADEDVVDGFGARSVEGVLRRVQQCRHLCPAGGAAARDQARWAVVDACRLAEAGWRA